MVVFCDIAYTTGDGAGHIVLEVAVESLMLTVVDLEVGKLAAAMLCCQWAFLHIYILSILLFLF